MGAGGALSDVAARGCRAARAPAAEGVQRLALPRVPWRGVARHAERPLPPWQAIDDQAQRWWRAGCLETLVHEVRGVLRLAQGRSEEPSAAVLDRRTLRS